MGAGDEIGLTEAVYQEMLGRYVATIEVLTKRVVAKDQRIAVLETQLAAAEAKATKKGPKEGDVKFDV